MLSFNSLELPYQHENKGPDVTTQLHDDPFTDLFDQYISQDSSSSDSVSEAIDFGGFDSGLNEQKTSSNSYVATQPLSSLTHQQGRRLHSSSYDTFSASRASESLLSRRHYKSLYFDKPTAAISRKELLNLEGKLSSEVPARQKVSIQSAPALPLRRKAKFTAESLRGQNQNTSKPVCTSTSDSLTMMRPSYYYRHETPSYQEWTQRFEQISLQTGNLPLSPPASATFATKASSSQGPQQLRRKESFNPPPPAVQGFRKAQITIPSPLPSPVPFDRQQSSDFSDNSQVVSRHMQSPSWRTPTANMDGFDFTVSPHDVQPDWPHSIPDNSDPYYQITGAAQSAPALAPLDTDFPNHGLVIDPYGHFISEDPSVDYSTAPLSSFSTTANDIHTPPLPQEDSNKRASTPESRPSSTCPSPPPPTSTKSPSRARQRSKCHRRSKSSISNLKSPKSAGSLGFVNFTPSDSQKILTGVAPSGSSKTKARRELEAHEKKRKLSLAVEKVVRDAGGDSAKLQLAGLL